MEIYNVKIIKMEKCLICKATVLSNNWKYCDNIEYYSDLARWASDYYSLSDSVKKMCRREWYKKAKEAGIRRKELNVMI